MIEVLAGLLGRLLTFSVDAARTLTSEALVFGLFVWLAGLLLVLLRPRSPS